VVGGIILSANLETAQLGIALMDLSIAYTAKLGLDHENYYAMIDETR